MIHDPARGRHEAESDRSLRDQPRSLGNIRPSHDEMEAATPAGGLSSGRPSSGRAAQGEDCQPKTKEIRRYSSHDALLTLYVFESPAADALLTLYVFESPAAAKRNPSFHFLSTNLTLLTQAAAEFPRCLIVHAPLT
jgi:hypothetical protein